MPLLTKGSPAARTAIIYVTLGALVLVWTGVYYLYLVNHPPAGDSPAYYWCYGFLATGIVLLLIGFGIGRLGRAARHAELPPQEVTGAVARADLNAAARAPVVAPNPAAPLVAQPGMAPAVPVAPAAPVVPTTAPVPPRT